VGIGRERNEIISKQTHVKNLRRSIVIRSVDYSGNWKKKAAGKGRDKAGRKKNQLSPKEERINRTSAAP